MIILRGQEQRIGCRPHEGEGQPPYGVLRRQDEQCDAQRHTERAQQRVDHARRISTAQSLRGESAGAHSQEAEEPVEDIEHHGAHRNGTDISGIADVAHNGHIDESQQRHRDVRHDRGYRQPQYLSVARRHQKLASRNTSSMSGRSSTRMLPNLSFPSRLALRASSLISSSVRVRPISSLTPTGMPMAW